MIGLAFPVMLSNGGINFQPNQHTYNPFSLAISVFAFYTGHDRNFFDKLTNIIFSKVLK
jgi:hypothetical protein